MSKLLNETIQKALAVLSREKTPDEIQQAKIDNEKLPKFSKRKNIATFYRKSRNDE